MPHQEIERKFLVIREKLPNPLPKGEEFIQSYLSLSPTVRVRIVDGKRAYMTVKGKGLISREEIEFEAPLDDARDMVALSPYKTVVKTRHRIPFAGCVWEVDVYHGELDGLLTVEVEMESEDQEIQMPEFVGEEVTEDSRFKNSALARFGLP
jgi:CYTH domain-containing protein